MPKPKLQSAVKAVTLLTFIMAVSQILGFLREMLLASAFGTGFEMDAYNMAYGLMMMLPIILTSYISSTYIPEYTLARNEGEDEASRFYSLVLTISFTASIVIAIAGCILAPQLVSLFASGFEGDIKSLTIRLLRILVWVIPAQIAINVWSSTLNARRSHIIPTLAAASINLFYIPAALFLAGRYGIWAIIGALFADIIFQVVFLYISVFRQGQRYRPAFDIYNPRLHKTIRLAIPSVAASATTQLNELVDRTISSSLPTGSVSAYSYAMRLAGFVPGIIFSTFLSVFMPRMSERSANKDKSGALDLMWRTVEILLSVALPVCAITTFMRTEIVRIVFERGAFGEESTAQVGLVLMFYIWIIVISAVSGPISNTFLAWQDTKGMVFRGALSVAVNTGFSILLAQYYGIIGIALGTLLGSGIYALALVITLRKRWGPLGLLRTVIEGVKMTSCAIVCGFLVRLLREVFPASNGTIIMDAFRFGTITVTCGGVYFGLTLLLRVRSVKEVFGVVTAKVRHLVKR